MALVLQQQGLHVETQKEIAVYFRGSLIGNFRADIVVEEKILLELKAVRCLESAHEAQLLNYLKATTTEVGLLMNFGNEPMFKRLVYNKQQEICLIRVDLWLNSYRCFLERLFLHLLQITHANKT
jgi:GxxExxY protein